MTIGAAIGCGLLAIIGFVIVVVAAQLLDRINAPSSAGVTPTAATAEPSLSPTGADAATVAPIGVRDPMDGSIIYVVEIQRGDGPITFQIASQPLSGTAALPSSPTTRAATSARRSARTASRSRSSATVTATATCT